MATCKECVHNNICNIKQRYNHPKYALQHIEKYCEHFKDRSRFVELPFKIGDTAYYIKAGTVQETIVTSFRISRIGIRLTRAGGYGLGFDEEIGRKIFFTYEEAEQVLAKQNQPDNTPQ